MKKLFALIALVAFFGAISTPSIAASYSTPVTVKVNDDKPKKAKTATVDSEKKSGCCTEKKAGCESKGCGDAEKK